MIYIQTNEHRYIFKQTNGGDPLKSVKRNEIVDFVLFDRLISFLSLIGSDIFADPIDLTEEHWPWQ